MIQRQRGVISGIVQGVGFRPFMVRLARQFALTGFVQNCAGSVTVEVEGPADAIKQFVEQLIPSAPPNSKISKTHWTHCSPQGSRTFAIVDSQPGGNTELSTPVDLAPCPACLQELDDPANRRYRYPFISCVDCGPRFSMIRATPFDRANTTMAEFEPCAHCADEYHDAENRRFHAQGICCGSCGPTLEFFGPAHPFDPAEIDPLQAAIDLLQAGKILALKGVGGYQLLVAADNEQAIATLRQRKRRPAKPFAVMVRDLESAADYATINDLDAQTLRSPAAPILLLPAAGRSLPASVSPGNPMLGIMLPASSLHALLARRMERPLVVTSGNLHGEPIITDDAEARQKLGKIADGFLSHNRAIVHAVDDSVVQIVRDKVQMLRFARGFAPRAFPMPGGSASILATGGHLKQTPLLLCNGQAICWPQVGDLDSWPARQAMADSLEALPKFLNQHVNRVATDRHPDYATRLWAEQHPRTAITVQHHHAHGAACLAEHGLDQALCVTWDGAGYGDDGNSWGGEFLQLNRAGYRRVASLRPFPLPGGEAAARNGWRVVAGLSAQSEQVPDDINANIEPYLTLAGNGNCPQSSSVGRLFDAVAAVSGLCPAPTFEGQAAMAVEHAANADAPPYPFSFTDNELDWQPMLAEMFADRGAPGRLTSRFHATLVAMVITVVEAQQPETVALCGGCFQNKLLVESCFDTLVDRGYRVIFAQQLPPGDGGLALGQAWVANAGYAKQLQNGEHRSCA
ncbi:MAG: carbamoyltransferase HypF [Gammaproteobacteria bacterium]